MPENDSFKLLHTEKHRVLKNNPTWNSSHETSTKQLRVPFFSFSLIPSALPSQTDGNTIENEPHFFDCFDELKFLKVTFTSTSVILVIPNSFPKLL